MRPCIYCGLNPGKTKDHTPPVAYFREALPNGIQRITVPCCEECRKEGEKDEAFCRNLIISEMLSEQNSIALTLARKRDKSFALDRTQAERLVAHMKYVPVMTPHGPALFPAFDADSPPMNNFVLRMCRALLHEETKTGFLKSKIVRWCFHPPKEEREIFNQAPARVVSEEFAYAHVYFRGEPVSAWLLQFYQGLEILAVMQTDWK